MRWFVLLAALFVHALATAAAAQTDEPPNNGALAIQKGKEGVAAFEKGKWEDALRLFREADGLYHSPVLVLYEARTLKNLGRLREARGRYQALVAEPIADQAPEPWKQAHRDGADELAELASAIPSVQVSVRGAPARAVAMIDETPIAIGEVVEIDPGVHRFHVEVDGAPRAEQTLTVLPGQHAREIAFDLTPPPEPPGPRPPPPRPEPMPDDGPDGWMIFGAVLTAVGGAAVITGAIFGGVALHEASNAESNLPPSCDADGRCPSFVEDDVQASFAPAYDKATAADVLLIGGGVLAAAGIVLLIVHPEGDAVSVRDGSLRVCF